MLIQISNACISCGACVKDCPRQVLSLENGRITSVPEICNRCGHCVAVCPTNAVSLEGCDMSEIYTLQPSAWETDPDKLLELMRMRRSVRQYAGKEVEPEKLRRILETGRFAPTACNYQGNRFVVVNNRDKSYQQLRRVVLSQLNQDAQHILNKSSDSVLRARANSWVALYQSMQDGSACRDTVFYNAPCIVTVVTPDIRDGGIVAAYMELMAVSQGLGALYNGIISGAIDKNQEARALLGIQEHEHAVICMLFGYPAVTYRRSVPREPVKAVML